MDIGPAELIIALVIILLLFGGKKLPEIARGLGRAQHEFKEGMQGESTAAPTTPTSTAAASTSAASTPAVAPPAPTPTETAASSPQAGGGPSPDHVESGPDRTRESAG
jgi:sec-independent protein translocase protein TatA